MDIWTILIYAGSTGFVLCLVPQFIKTFRSKHADDLSLGFLILVIASSAVTFPYMIHQREFVFAVAQGANLVVWGTVLYYKVRPRPS